MSYYLFLFLNLYLQLQSNLKTFRQHSQTYIQLVLNLLIHHWIFHSYYWTCFCRSSSGTTWNCPSRTLLRPSQTTQSVLHCWHNLKSRHRRGWFSVGPLMGYRIHLGPGWPFVGTVLFGRWPYSWSLPVLSTELSCPSRGSSPRNLLHSQFESFLSHFLACGRKKEESFLCFSCMQQICCLQHWLLTQIRL